MNRPPSFLFYPKDWLSSKKITAMTLEEEGAYIHLLAHCWESDDCTLPGDEKTLAVLSRMGERWFTDASAQVRACFIPHPKHPGHLTNERLLKEFTSLQKFRRAKQRAGHVGGVKSGLSRRQTKRNTTEADLHSCFDSASSKTEANGSSSSSSSSPSPSSNKENAYMCNGGVHQDRREGFERFWTAYPRKQHKGDAEEWFKKNRPTAELVDQMLAKIAEFKTSDAWQKDKGKYVPLPFNWLDAKSWHDQVRVDVPVPKPRLAL